MPGRKFNGGDYRYGFGGKENDNEIKGEGNSIDFGARMYDSRLGRWFAVDPLAAKYPSMSPYNFVANNPIFFVDPDGRDIEVPKVDQGKVLLELVRAFGENGEKFSFDKFDKLVYNGSENDFSNENELEVFKGLNSLMKSEETTGIIYEKNEDTDIHDGEATIVLGDPGTEDLAANMIYIDPSESYTGAVEKDLYATKDGVGTVNPNPNSLQEKENLKLNGNNQPYKIGTKKVVETAQFRSNRYSRLFHGIGHVLFKKKSEQEKVIDYENKARSIHEKLNKKKKAVKSKPIKHRSVDESHRNKPN